MMVRTPAAVRKPSRFVGADELLIGASSGTNGLLVSSSSSAPSFASRLRGRRFIRTTPLPSGWGSFVPRIRDRFALMLARRVS